MSDTIKMNMIEKVARAQAAVCSDCKKLGKVDWEAHLEDARAAIAAMREPTNDMANEYYKLRKECGDIDATACFNVSVWEAMIDAALKE